MLGTTLPGVEPVDGSVADVFGPLAVAGGDDADVDDVAAAVDEVVGSGAGATVCAAAEPTPAAGVVAGAAASLEQAANNMAALQANVTNLER